MPSRTSSLWIDGEPLDTPPDIAPSGLLEAVLARPQVRERACELVALSASLSRIGPSDPALYISQRECAAVPLDRPVIIGSDAATTCNILIAVGHSAVFCAHLDGTPGQIHAVIRELRAVFPLGPAQQDLDLHLAGGFDDDRGSSAQLGAALLAGLHCAGEADLRFHLRTCCIGPLNTVPVTVQFGGKEVSTVGPAVRALAWDMRAGRLLVNAWYADRGPEAVLRAAFSIAGTLPLARPYDTVAGSFVFGPDYCLGPISPWHIDQLLALDDESLLLQVSTSPHVEHQTFPAEFRQVLHFLKSYNPRRR